MGVKNDIDTGLISFLIDLTFLKKKKGSFSISHLALNKK
jgi:hypothetical protein